MAETSDPEPRPGEGPVAVVTGGSSGIGRAIVDRFIQDGARVVVGDIQPGPDSAADYVHCDVRDEDAVANLIHVADAAGGVDILVNCAGIAPKCPIDEMSLEAWRGVIDTNLTAAMLTMKYAVPVMKRKGRGNIINIANIAAIRTGSPFNSAYAASKGAIVTMTRALVHELSPHGIRINALAPGLVESPLTQRFGAAWNEARKATVPGGRMAQPEEIASVASFLASNDASYVNGQLIVVDGGLMAIMMPAPGAPAPQTA